MSSVAKSLLLGAKEAVKYASGHKKGARRYKIHKIKVPQQVDVKDIRLQLNLSRSEFSDKFGFSARTLEKLEQGIQIQQPEPI